MAIPVIYTFLYRRTAMVNYPCHSLFGIYLGNFFPRIPLLIFVADMVTRFDAICAVSTSMGSTSLVQYPGSSNQAVLFPDSTQRSDNFLVQLLGPQLCYVILIP